MNKLPVDLPKNCFDCKAPAKEIVTGVEFECGGDWKIKKVGGVYTIKYNSCKKLEGSK